MTDDNHIMYEVNGEMMGAHKSLDDAVLSYLEDHFDCVDDYPSVVTVVERIVVKRTDVNICDIVHAHYAEDGYKRYTLTHGHEDRVDFYER